MRVSETSLSGAYIIEPDAIVDERGFFARTFCRSELAKLGLDSHIEQCSISFNKKKGTLRGIHYQAAPHEETKIVRCTKGAIFDVIVDLRPSSATYYRWLGVELTEENRRMLYIPKGFAHGFQSLVDQAEVFYQISAAYVAEAARGLRWNDPRIGIEWPLPDPVMSKKDAEYALLGAQ